ncbi:MAG: D-Ala-D-Ala carboxypeptidase family metallohydrolase [Candidatus Eisenbacteria bacterium]
MSSSSSPMVRLCVRSIALAALSLLLVSPAHAEEQGAGSSFDAGRASFSVRTGGEVNPYRILAVCAMPGEGVNIEVVESAVAGVVVASAGEGDLLTSRPGRWVWTAPRMAGIYPVELGRQDTGEAMTLNMLVLVPASSVSNCKLNGYRIGSYPGTAWNGLAVYRPPRGFIEVTEANSDTPVSPHFTLGQFLSKQQSGYPKYVVLRERLLLKLELVLEHVNAAGIRADSLHIMSGYRTPYYNHSIGNVDHSRHLWGGAADIFVDDHPEDGVMDDLNADGVCDVKDARVLYEIIDGLYGKSFYQRLLGGLGHYRRSAGHGPFVHVDVRGFRARWGD